VHVSLFAFGQDKKMEREWFRASYGDEIERVGVQVGQGCWVLTG
jgi:hypothetical protein